MEELRNPIILTSLTLYIAACIGVGLWALRRTHSARDFFMAGRNLGVFVTAMAVFTSTLSGFAFVGGPGLVYAMGASVPTSVRAPDPRRRRLRGPVRSDHVDGGCFSQHRCSSGRSRHPARLPRPLIEA
jgi:hypothetical protein